MITFATLRKAGRAVETAIQNIGGWLEHSSKQAWGIPWIDDDQQAELRPHHSRLLNADWLFEEIESSEIERLEQQIEREQDSAHYSRLTARISRSSQGILPSCATGESIATIPAILRQIGMYWPLAMAMT